MDRFKYHVEAQGMSAGRELKTVAHDRSQPYR